MQKVLFDFEKYKIELFPSSVYKIDQCGSIWHDVSLFEKVHYFI
jgi:hypothetical protein